MTRKRFTAILVLSLVIAASISCDDEIAGPPVVCTTEFVWGLEIRLVDSETGGPTGLGAWATITDGDYKEVTLCEDRGHLGVATIAAGERAGTYDISIAADGYLEWTREGVRVTKDECHVQTVSITAELVREDP